MKVVDNGKKENAGKRIPAIPVAVSDAVVLAAVLNIFTNSWS